MPYGFRIELDSFDISDKVARFEIQASLDQYCRELSLDLADQDLFDSIDFGRIPEQPQIEVFTRTYTEWVSQGRFFIEKPTFSVGVHQTSTGIWGRSETAILGPPFASKVRKTWETDTTFYSICEELCELAGVTWDPQYCEVDDFTVYAYSFQADNSYPIEVIAELVGLAHGGDTFPTTDKDGNFRIRKLERLPAAADVTVDDLVTVQIEDEPEWPDFGNRIRISAAGGVGGFGVSMTTPVQCMVADGATRAKLYARVTDADGNAANDVPVDWTAMNGLVMLDRPSSNTQQVTISGELVRARSFRQIELKFPPETIKSIYAFKDISKANNFADLGYTLDGNVVRLASDLNYCDQLLRVTYKSSGVAVNWAEAGLQSGTEQVIAQAYGNQASIELYLDNPCMCPPVLTLQARPSSIEVGQYAVLLVYVEIGGAPVNDGRTVYMTIDSSPSHGKIAWTKASLGKVNIQEEQVAVTNEVAGLSQIELSMFPASVTSVFECYEDEEGNLQPVGDDLYDSHVQKVVNLTTELPTGMTLLVNYVAVGAVTNTFEGLVVGTDRVRALMVTTREERTEAQTSIMVSLEGGGGGDDPPPDDCCNDGLCHVEGTPCGESVLDCAAEGKVLGMSGGALGCYSEEELDSCGDGNVYCYKEGALGCNPIGECDTQGGSALIRCKKEGTDGCFKPEECDPCGEEGKIYCYKGGILGCNAPTECDSTTGAAGDIECQPGTKCCKNGEGINGCWPPEQCSDDPGKPPKPPEDWPPDKPKPPKQCVTADKGKSICPEDKACCTKNGQRGCYKLEECDKGPDYCFATDCHKDPSADCLTKRFGKGFQDGGSGCSCLEMCDKEMQMYGTTQEYDGGSYKTIDQLVNERYGYQVGTPEFYEKYDELKEEAMAECREQCGDCEDADEGPLAISGPEEVSSPGGFQYTVSGGRTPYVWTATGSGASIDDGGFLTLAQGACGAVHVTVSDACGRHISMDARITNNGQWVQIEYIYLGCHTTTWGNCDNGVSGICTSGKYRYHEVLGSCPPSQGLETKCGCHNSLYGIGIRITDEWRC